jgi:multidrug efflux pump subunit AcrA (membrane-fusion protein)
MTNLSRWRYWPFSGILFLAGCGAAPPRASENLSKPPIEVQAFSVQVRDIPLLYTVTGTVHARVQSPLASQIVATIVFCQGKHGRFSSCG